MRHNISPSRSWNLGRELARREAEAMARIADKVKGFSVFSYASRAPRTRRESEAPGWPDKGFPPEGFSLDRGSYARMDPKVGPNRELIEFIIIIIAS